MRKSEFPKNAYISAFNRSPPSPAIESNAPSGSHATRKSSTEGPASGSLAVPSADIFCSRIPVAAPIPTRAPYRHYPYYHPSPRPPLIHISPPIILPSWRITIHASHTVNISTTTKPYCTMSRTITVTRQPITHGTLAPHTHRMSRRPLRITTHPILK